MDFTEFREKFSISQDKLHKLTLEAHKMFVEVEAERQSFEKEYPEEEFEYSPGSYRDELVFAFTQLLCSEVEYD